jgi:hypothetical protein
MCLPVTLAHVRLAAGVARRSRASSPRPLSPVSRAALGFASWQRALIARAGQSTILEHGIDKNGDTLRIVTQDLRGTSQLELPLSGSDVAANDGDGGARVHRAVAIERGAKPSVVVTERFPHEREPYSICRRTLQPDGRMCIEVQKRTGVHTRPGGAWRPWTWRQGRLHTPTRGYTGTRAEAALLHLAEAALRYSPNLHMHMPAPFAC